MARWYCANDCIAMHAMRAFTAYSLGHQCIGLRFGHKISNARAPYRNTAVFSLHEHSGITGVEKGGGQTCLERNGCSSVEGFRGR